MRIAPQFWTDKIALWCGRVGVVETDVSVGKDAFVTFVRRAVGLGRCRDARIAGRR